MAVLPELVQSFARNEIGVTEVNGTNCGPRVNEYKAATWLDPTLGWPWCAAFVDWCVWRAMDAAGTLRFTFSRPRTAGAWDLENWCKQQDNSVILKKPHKCDIQAGDLLVFKFSHCGISDSAPDKNGYVTTIEGNTDGAGSREGGAVLRKKRHVDSVRSRIRFAV
jgi:hypothetical protein